MKTTFVDVNPAQGIPGTIVGAAMMNGINNHRHRGLAEDGDGALDYAADTGSANACAIALVPVLSAYIVGMPVWFKSANTNTGAATLNINSLGAVQIKKNGNKDLVAGDLLAGMIVGVVYDGTNFQLLTRAMSEDARPGDLIFSTLASVPAGTLKINGATLSRSAYAALFANTVPQMAVSISIAAPGVLTTAVAHGLVVGDRVRLASTGALPTGLAVTTDYYVVSVPSSTTFTLAATVGGTAITTSGTQSGTHTLSVWRGYGPGDGAATFTLPDARGYGLRLYDDGAGVDSGRVLGSLQADAFQGHWHQLNTDSANPKTSVSSAAGSSSAMIALGNGSAVGTFTSGAYMVDGSNGAPRVAPETRMKNFAIQAFVKY